MHFPAHSNTSTRRTRLYSSIPLFLYFSFSSIPYLTLCFVLHTLSNYSKGFLLILKLRLKPFLPVYYLLAHNTSFASYQPRNLTPSYNQLAAEYHTYTGMRYSVSSGVEPLIIDPSASASIRPQSECLINRIRLGQNGNLGKGDGGGHTAAGIISQTQGAR